MEDNRKSAGPGIAFAVIGMVVIAGFLCWAVVGVYREVETGKRASRERMERASRQIAEREAEAARQLSTSPPSENP